MKKEKIYMKKKEGGNKVEVGMYAIANEIPHLQGTIISARKCRAGMTNEYTKCSRCTGICGALLYEDFSVSSGWCLGLSTAFTTYRRKPTKPPHGLWEGKRVVEGSWTKSHTKLKHYLGNHQNEKGK